MDVAQLERLIIFPLPRVVLLPAMPMPLHIFEPRYRAMTRQALDHERYIAMATLHPSGEVDAAQRPLVRPYVGVGAITEWEELPDGRFHILLEGVGRARVLTEHRTSEPYREVRAEAVPDVDPDPGATRRSFEAVRGLMRAWAPSPRRPLLREELDLHPEPAEFSNRLGAMIHGDVESQYELLTMTNVTERMDAIVEHLSDFLARTSSASEDLLN
ncbi:MAG: LON peptidase substrate-binding domain-containing protein [Sandaracinaceae bacterium]|nr:LON peptidase substrate-binding domain-containing protein [Sandaracinaceae bacterium]